jgi:RimJ/RimL family protein N-acetyltransferase
MAGNLEILTERLVLRSIHLDDAEAIYQYRSDSRTNQYQNWIPKTINDVYDFINNRVSPTIDVIDTWYQFVIMKKEQSDILGDIGVHFLDSGKEQVELGCTFDKKFQGKGYATEAMKETIHFLFNILHKRRIIVSTDPRNIKAIRLAERLGFRKEALCKESIRIHGEWADDLQYAVLKDEWMQYHAHCGFPTPDFPASPLP